MTKKKLSNLFHALSVVLIMLSVFFAFMMLFFIDSLVRGQSLWLPILSGSLLFFGLLFSFAYCEDWLLDALEAHNKRREEKKKEKEEKEKELTYNEDYDYKKLAEEKAYFNDFDGPQDIEKFLVMLKRNYPQLNWVETVYVTYLTGMFHGEMYKK